MKLKVRPDDASMLQMNDWLAELREDGCAEPPPRGARRGARSRPLRGAPSHPPIRPPRGARRGARSRPAGMPGRKPPLNLLPRQNSLAPSSPLPPPGALCGL